MTIAIETIDPQEALRRILAGDVAVCLEVKTAIFLHKGAIVVESLTQSAWTTTRLALAEELLLSGYADKTFCVAPERAEYVARYEARHQTPRKKK